MKEYEDEHISDTEMKKRKIRERYKGINSDDLDFIPAKEKEKIGRAHV